jgi:hypothetical protein
LRLLQRYQTVLLCFFGPIVIRSHFGSSLPLAGGFLKPQSMAASSLDNRQGVCRISDVALEVRKWQRDNYEALHAMYSEFIDALKGAIDALGGHRPDNDHTKSAVLKIKGMCSTGMCPQTLEEKVNVFFMYKGNTSYWRSFDMFKEELKEVHSEFVALLDFLREQEDIRIDTFRIGRQGFEI